MHNVAYSVPDYLLIGHIAHDVTRDGPRLGGTVSFGAHTAYAFGLRVAILTSSQPGEPLLKNLPPEVEVVSVPAEHTTTFENRYAGRTRTQYLHHRARTLHPDMLPPAWREAKLVHLAPIAYEVDPEFATVFADRPICVTPQGFMRQREPDGLVTARPWDTAHHVLSRARVTVLSEEDIRHNPALEAEFAAMAPLVIVTRAERGGTIYEHGEPRDYPAIPVNQVNPTGAGDVFAAALHIALDRLGNLDQAVTIASYLGAQSVTRAGFSSAPTPDEIVTAWRLAGADEALLPVALNGAHGGHAED